MPLWLAYPRATPRLSCTHASTRTRAPYDAAEGDDVNDGLCVFVPHPQCPPEKDVGDDDDADVKGVEDPRPVDERTSACREDRRCVGKGRGEREQDGNGTQ